MPLDDVDFQYESRTMTEAQILKDLDPEAYKTEAETHNYSDAPAAVKEPPPAAQVPDPSSAPAGASGEPLAVEAPSGETPAVSETAQPQEHEVKGGFKKKIKALSAETGSLKQKLAERDARLAELERKLAETSAAAKPSEAKPAVPAAAAPAAAEANDDPRPVPTDDENEYDPSYLERLTRWTVRDEGRERKRSEETARTSQVQSDVAAAVAAEESRFKERWGAQIDEIRALYDDADAVLTKPHPKNILNGIMNSALVDREDGAELRYWLATHPDEANTIYEATLTGPADGQEKTRNAFRAVHREFDRITALFEADPAAPLPPAVKPAAPAAPQKATPAPVVTPAAPKAQAPPPAAQVPPAAPPVAKPIPPPIRPVGTRGGTAYKSLRQMSDQELRDLPLDGPGGYRDRLQKGEGGA